MIFLSNLLKPKNHTPIDSNIRTFGKAGEDFVVKYLQEQDYTVLAQNYRKRCGEIDVIVQKGEVLAFVEVKTRMHKYFDLSQVITQTKQKRIIAATKNYLASHLSQDRVIRFDVALVEKTKNGFSLNYILDAFTSDGF